MPNIIKIKRSQVTATPTSLAEGELAYSELSDNLFLGKSGSNIGVVGGGGTFAPKASPAFTGTPTAPTPDSEDNSTKIATTAFVKAQGYSTETITAGGGLTKTGSSVDVGAGQGIQVDDDSITVKLDGSTLTKSSSGLKVTDNTYLGYSADIDGGTF